MSVEQFLPRRGPIILSASASGPADVVDMRLLLDTGASMTSIRTETLIQLGYDPSQATEGVDVLSIGRVDRKPVIRVNRLSSLGKHRLGIAVVANDFPDEFEHDGILGLDFLQECRLIIDFKTGVIELQG